MQTAVSYPRTRKTNLLPALSNPQHAAFLYDALGMGFSDVVPPNGTVISVREQQQLLPTPQSCDLWCHYLQSHTRSLLHPSRAISNRARCLSKPSHVLLKKQESYLRKLTQKSLPGLILACRTFLPQKQNLILRMLIGINAKTRQACT